MRTSGSARSINYARNIIEIEEKVINIVKYTKKSLLFHDGKALVRKEENPLFNVTIGSYDKAQICKPVKLYLLIKRTPLVSTKNEGIFMG